MAIIDYILNGRKLIIRGYSCEESENPIVTATVKLSRRYKTFEKDFAGGLTYVKAFLLIHGCNKCTTRGESIELLDKIQKHYVGGRLR